MSATDIWLPLLLISKVLRYTASILLTLCMSSLLCGPFLCFKKKDNRQKCPLKTPQSHLLKEEWFLPSSGKTIFLNLFSRILWIHHWPMAFDGHGSALRYRLCQSFCTMLELFIATLNPVMVLESNKNEFSMQKWNYYQERANLQIKCSTFLKFLALKWLHIFDNQKKSLSFFASYLKSLI